MEFFIKKGATLPILQLGLIPNSKHGYNDFYDMVQNSTITFSMTNIDSGVKKIFCKEALCINRLDTSSDIYDKFILSYKFNDRDTNTVGSYYGEFTINFNDNIGKLIVPIKDKLLIHVIN